MTDFIEGETVLIVNGIYRMHKKGEYVRHTGQKSVVVIIGGKERTIRSKSIKKMPSMTSTQTNGGSATVTISREAFTGMVTEIDNLSKRLNALELKMKRYT